MFDSSSKAVVSITRKWDARQAGKDIAENIVNQLNTNPKFIILFSTIHYEKYGGFEELLNGIYDVLPQDVQLAGGTVRGFSNNYGSYTRGATALAVSDDDMDVAIGVGNNTKRNPEKAAQNCASMIKNKLQNSNYPNGFLLNIISGAEIPNIPPIGTKKIIEPGAAPKTLMKLFSFSQKTLQMGAARDEEIIDEMTSLLPDYFMLSGATIDDGPGFKNYQFHNKTVLKNAIVSLGIKTNKQIFVKTTKNMKNTEIEFEITKMSKDQRIIHEINGQPALNELLRLLKWPREILNEETWLKTTFYFPIGGKCVEKAIDDNIPHIIGIILGNSLLLTCKLTGTQAKILTIDGKRLLNAIDDNIKSYDIHPEFGLIASCTTRLETLGNKVYTAKERIDNFMNGKPFIVFYVGGESTYSPEKGLDYAGMSFNTAFFT